MSNYDPSTQQMGCRRSIISTLIIIIGTGLCVFTVIFSIDTICFNDAQQTIPYYPNAEIISEQTNGTRMWGLGYSTAMLYTTDESEAIRAFYSSLGPKPLHMLAKVDRTTSRSDEGGINIFLVSACSPM